MRPPPSKPHRRQRLLRRRIHGPRPSGICRALRQRRRDVVDIAGPLGTAAGIDRLEGYRSGLVAAGLEVRDRLIRVGEFSTQSGAVLTQSLIQQVPDLGGLFVCGELMAYGALATLRRTGRVVPHDVAVVSFDDLTLPIPQTRR